MHSITTALENLTRQLSQEIPATPGLCVFDAPFPLNDAFDALSWLASPSHPFRNSTGNSAMATKKLPFSGQSPFFHRSIWRNGFYVSTRSLTCVFGG